jgi:hypothetical protein
MTSPKTRAFQISSRLRQADDYYLERQSPGNIAKGLELLRTETSENPKSYEAWWRISKSLYYEACHASGSEKVKLTEQGIDAGKKAVAVEPQRVEGHFWLGANEDLIVESRGFFRGLLWIDSVRKEMEIANRLDPDYESGAALRILARLDYRAPFFLGGDKRRSIERLKECLTQHPDDSTAMLYLADSDMSLGHRDEAREQLQAILRLDTNPQDGTELADNQAQARARLQKYFHAPK